PVFLPRLAGGERRLAQQIARASEEGETLGAAARGALPLQQVGRVLEHAGLRLQAAELAVEAQPVGEDRRVLAPRLDAAARAVLEIADAVQDFGVDAGRAGEIDARVLRDDWRGGGERDGQRRKAVRHRATVELFR